MNEIKFIKRILESDKKRSVESKSFYDILIDNKSIFDELESDENNACILGFYNDKNLNIDIVNQFLKTKDSELQTGRIMLLVCRECGDIGCGSITLEIQKNEDSYVWKNFAHENDSFELIETDFLDIEPKEFSKNEYENALNDLKANWL